MAIGIIKMPKRFNYSCINEFNHELANKMNGANAVHLDCEALDYIDSAGIGILVMAQKKTKSAGVSLAMIKINKNIRDILEIANLQKMIDFK